MPLSEIDWNALALSAADLTGIVAFALAGILASVGRKLDPVGVYVMAFTTAFGGGIVRDVMIDNRPFYWLDKTGFMWVVLFMAIFAPSIIRRFRQLFPNSVFIWLDAIGLGFFSACGTSLSINAGAPLLASAILGVVTGAFGGMVRDVLLNKVPMVLRDKMPYATAAFAGNWLYILLINVGAPQGWSIWIASIVIVAFRMVSWYGKMPIIRYNRRL